jgi:translation initiation factor IF-3
VEVANQADPPVCRVMDYGKFKYEQSQKAKESRKKATHVLVKEMKYRPKIGSGDFETKTRRVEKFLSEGSKVKVTIMFRGREIQYPQLGRKILDDIAESISHVGRVEVYPEQEGRNMTMLLTPGKATRRQREAIEALQAEALEMEEASEEIEPSLMVDGEQANDETSEEIEPSLMVDGEQANDETSEEIEPSLMVDEEQANDETSEIEQDLETE